MFNVFENFDITRHIFSYANSDYLFFGTVSKNCMKCYMNIHNKTTTSFNSGLDGYNRIEESIDSGFRKKLNVYIYAIKMDSFETMKHLYSRRLHFDLRVNFIDSILFNRLDMFKWISRDIDKESTYWFTLAAQFGKIPFLEALKDLGYPFCTDTTLEAAEFGNIDALKWLYENGCPIDERVIVRAAVKGYEEIIVWCSGIVYDPPVKL